MQSPRIGNRLVLAALSALLGGLCAPAAAQQQAPSTSATADMRLWGRNADGAWVPVVLDASGNLPVSAAGGIGASSSQQLAPSTSGTTDARLWGQTAAGVWVPVVLDSTGHLPIAADIDPSPPAAAEASPNYVIDGGQVVWISSYTFRVSAAVYVIDGTQYTSTEQTITLTAADGSNPRLDVLALNDAGVLVKVTGTAAATPSEPTIDPGSQLKLGLVSVPASSSQPAAAASTTLYLENAGSGGGEWDCTTSGSGFNCNSSADPRTTTKNIDGTAVASGAYVQLAIGSSSFDPATRNLLVFYIKSKATWTNKRGLDIGLFSAGVLKGTRVTLNRTGSFGFDSAITTAYQQIAIPLDQFQVPAGTTVTQLRLIDFGGSIGFSVDDVTFQGGAVTPVVEYALSDLTNVKTTATPRVARIGLGCNPDTTYVAKICGSYYSVLVDDGNSSTADTIDWSAGNEHLSTLTGSVTYTFSNPIDGGRYVLLVATGAGSFTATWPGNVLWPGGTAPVITATAAKVDLITFIYVLSTNKYYGSFNQNY